MASSLDSARSPVVAALVLGAPFAHASTTLGPEGSWTINSITNCRVPNKVYQIDLVLQGKEVRFEVRNVGTKLNVEIGDWENKDRVGTYTSYSETG